MFSPANRCLLGRWFKDRLPHFTIIICLATLIFAWTSQAAAPQKSAVDAGFANRQELLQKATSLQIPFIANQGQIQDASVRFYARTLGGTVSVDQDGRIRYVFPQNRSAQPLVLKESLVNAHPSSPVGKTPSHTKVNYFKGSRKDQWRTRIATFDEVGLGEVYHGVELYIKAYGKTVEKIFEVQPGTDPQQIRIELQGADTLSVNAAGELEAKTGSHVARFSRPKAYQDVDGQRKPIPVAYQVAGNRYSFALSPYDPSRPLVIDPCLTYATLIGGDSDDKALSMTVGLLGAVYIGGSTYSFDFSYDPSYQAAAGDYDAFLMKIDPENSVVDYFTFLGGELYDAVYGIALDETGAVYATGETQSKTFPDTKKFYDSKIGGNTDAFVVKLSSDGSKLEFSTYLGGGGPDKGYAIAVKKLPDEENNEQYYVFVAGETLSSNFPITPGVVFAKSKGGVDGFITKLNHDGMFLVYSTFYGGGGDDICLGIDVNSDGEAYVTGRTSSGNLTVKPLSPLDNTLGGVTDAFAAKFNADGSDVLFSTYIGGPGVDIGHGIALVDNGVLITGETTQPFAYSGVPVIIGDNLGQSDAFVFHLNASGTGSGYNVLIGGGAYDAAYDIAVDPGSKHIFIAGETHSSDFPSTDNGGALNDSDNTIASDGFFARLNPIAPDPNEILIYSGYVGEEFNDVVNSIGIRHVVNNLCSDPSEIVRVYVSGYTDSTPVADYDAFIAGFEDSDGDGASDGCDNCLCTPNPDQANNDQDSLGDACDNCDFDDNELQKYETGDSLPSDEGDPTTECARVKWGLDPVKGDFWQPDYDCDEVGDACDPDIDGDGLPNWWEEKYFGSPVSPYGPDDDPDGEGLDNQGEFDAYDDEEDDGPNPQKADTDDDGWNDLWEDQAGTVPFDGSSKPGFEIFQNGIFVDKAGGSDINLGNESHPVKSIHAAVVRLNLLDDTGFVYTIKFKTSGTYKTGDPEPDLPLVVNKSVIFNGVGITVSGEAAIEWKQGFVFEAASADVVFNGMDIEKFDQGLVFSTLLGSGDLINTTIQDCGTGILLLNAAQLQLQMNAASTIESCFRAVAIEGVSDENTLSGITVVKCDVGILAAGGKNNQVVNTSIGSSDFRGTHGIKMDVGAESLSFSGSIENFDVGVGFATNGACLTLPNTTIFSCRAGIEFLENYMLQIDLVDDQTLITGCDAGILFRAGSSNNLVTHGKIEANDEGIVFEPCDPDGETPDDNRVVGSLIGDNLFHGISVVGGVGNRFQDCTLRGNETGIAFYGGSGNQAENCLVSGSNIGAAFYGGTENQLLNTDITSNGTGVYIRRTSSGNRVSGGSIQNNSSDNFWIDGDHNRVENITLLEGPGNSLGHISGSANELDNISITGDGSGTGLVVPGGSISLNDMSISNFNIGIEFAVDAACLTFTGDSDIEGCDTCDAGMLIADKHMLDIDLGPAEIRQFENGIKIVAGSSNNTIRNGIVTANRGNGIHVEACGEAPEENRIVATEVTGNGSNGIALLGGFNNQVSGCRIHGNNFGSPGNGYGGVLLVNGSAVLSFNKIFQNGCNGIFVDEAVDVDIINNLVYRNPTGIQISTFTENVVVGNNTVSNNQENGLFIGDGALPLVQYNIIYGNGSTGECPEDICLEGAFEPTLLVENNIGSVNKIDLPTKNTSLDPKFVDPSLGADDYQLQSSSFCIDGTSRTEPGVDLNGHDRPKGRSWDMGAYEALTFRDEDLDGLPDDWEEDYFDGVIDCDRCGALDDYDGDGIVNLQEYMEGADPSSPVYVRITSPANNPYFTDADSVAVAGESVNATSILINGDALPGSGFDIWSKSDVSLLDGINVILVEANGTVDDTAYSDTDTVTVIKDSAAPTVSIISPTSEGTYATALQTISIMGLANDDTEVSQVRWQREVEVVQDPATPDGVPVIVVDMVEGDATGAENWVAGAIPLLSGKNTITITAEDFFGKTGSAIIYVDQNTAETQTTNVEGDAFSGGVDPFFEDPLDADLDEYTNDDEIACGSDPFDGGEGAQPDNYAGMRYPVGHEQEGYLWPDCLNPDIDGDGLPNWWEAQYFSGSETAANPDADDEEEPDGFHNLQEFENGTNPLTSQSAAFALTVLSITDIQQSSTSYDESEWLPEFGQTLTMQAKWILETPPPSMAVFSLKQTTSHPGRATNDPNPAEVPLHQYPAWYFDADNDVDQYHGPDFGLTAYPVAPDSCSQNCFNQGKIFVEPEQPGGDTYLIYLHVWDYGGKTNLLVTDSGNGNFIGQKWIPHGSNINGIGAAWKIAKDSDGISTTIETIAVDPLSLDPNADVDRILFENPSQFSAPLGDDFSNFEEYRGIVYLPANGDPLFHERLDPFRKDLFIRAEGFYGNYEFDWGPAFNNAGIVVHNTTEWGHDATEDQSFYIYYRQGKVIRTETDLTGEYKRVIASNPDWSTTWPKHEWEFKLATHGDTQWTPIAFWSDIVPEDGQMELGLDFGYGALATGEYDYDIRKPLPHINILIVRHDPNGLFGAADGRIRFVSANPPSQQNPLGTRFWRWSTKGYTWCQLKDNQSSMYGLAVTLEKPLNHYFNDHPYLDGSTWTGAAWDASTQDGKLNPLSHVEDQSDLMNPIDGIMAGDSPNGAWDGDRRLPSYALWDSDGTLNPFNIDGDTFVELPLAANPDDVNGDGLIDNTDPGQGDVQSENEYSLKQVLKHTITHEMGHALAGPTHTNDPQCLMYRYSNNWDRDDRFSDIYRSLLRVHNITR